MNQNPFLKRLQSHETMRDSLLSLVNKRRVPHALLFVGPEGVGKRLLAYGIAAQILQAGANSPEQSFLLLENGNHPDLHPLQKEEDKKDISVEAVRNLRSALQLQPFLGNSSVAIIDDAHLMSIAASNALLLTLEEPAAGRYLMLVTHAPHKLPETIVSRCQMVHLGGLHEKHVRSVLEMTFPKLIQEKDWSHLRSLVEDSFSALALGEHVNARTLRVESPADAWKSVKKLLARCEEYEVLFSRAFSERNELPGDALSLASLVAEVKGDPLPWILLRTLARKALRESNAEHATLTATNLLKALEAERLVFERNASPALQLSSLFLELNH